MIFLISIETAQLLGLIILAIIAGIIIYLMFDSEDKPTSDDDKLEDAFEIGNFEPTQASTQDQFYVNLALVNQSKEFVTAFVVLRFDTNLRYDDGIYYAGTLYLDYPQPGEQGELFHEFPIILPHNPQAQKYRIMIEGLGEPPYHDVHDPR